MPHGYCYLWDPRIVWLHVISDGLITLSYYCIPVALIYLLQKRRDLPFNWVFWMFGLFILGCGTTHLMEIWTVWHPSYLVAGVIKAITAVVSVMTALMLVPLLPKAIALPTSEQLNAINHELRLQMAERQASDEKLRETMAARERTLAELGDRQSAIEELQLAQAALREQVYALDQHAIVATTDVEGNITYVNDKFCAISKYSRAEMIGQNHRVLNSGHHSRKFFQQMYRAIANGQVWREEIRNRAKDGSIYWVDTTIVPFLEADGKPRQYMAIRTDITDCKRAEEARGWLAAIVESSDDAIMSKTLDGTITAWNRGAEKIFGYSAEEAVGKLMLMLFPPEIASEEPDILARIGRGESVEHFDTVRIRKDGRSIDVSVTISPIRDGNGAIVGASKVARDITERKQAERQLADQASELSAQALKLEDSRQALEDQTLLLQSVLDSMTEGLVVADPQGKFVLWNPAATEIVGMGAANVPPEEWSQHYGVFLEDTVTPFPPEKSPLKLAIDGVASGAIQHVRNVELEHGVWIELSASPLRDKSGMARGGVAAFRDITQRVLDEQKIRALNEELEERVAQRTAQLEFANHELEAFTYSVSHDLRAPLRHIGGFSRILIEDFGSTLQPEARDHLQRIEDGTQRMGRLVDELLNLARVGRHALNLQPAQLNPIIDEVINLLQPEAEGREVNWKISQLPLAVCDPILIKQVFQNLLANALKFTRTRDQAVIEITNHQENGETVILIHDNGVGFNMKYKDKLFGVFQRLHRAEDFDGTGVGLALVQRIVLKHGGRVWAEAEVDKGATFYFTLHAAKPTGSIAGEASVSEGTIAEAQPHEVENKTATAGGEM